MAQSCLLRTASKGAITLPQFTDALHQTCLEARRFRPGLCAGAASILPRKLGLAVSGGTDSMALAYLCRQWEIQVQKEAGNGVDADVSVTAFVVDHKARSESTQEANNVAGYLRDLGINTHILPLDWTGISKSAFETQARRLRFQALGTACRDRGINALLLGHHQDDNVETTLWRLATGARGAGLAGIAPAARIPECHGLYGVAGSGGSAIVDRSTFIEREQQAFSQRKDQRSTSTSTSKPWNISTGGILLHRPLLSFPKSSLVATCHENDVPYVSDPTNFDPTLTPRNAIRFMLSSNALPKALQNDSILSLVQNSQTLIRDLDRLSDDVLRFQCKLLDFSLASGCLTVQFKTPPGSESESSDLAMQDQKERQIPYHPLHEAQTLTLRRLTELVSPFPDNHWSLRSFVDFQNNIFRLSPNPGQMKRRAFTLGGTIFHPHKTQAQSRLVPKTRTIKTATSTSTSTSPSTSPDAGMDNRNRDNTWRISRQPYFRGREPVLRFDVPCLTLTHPNTNTNIDPQQQQQQQQQHVSVDIPWTLWDNRFWLRVSITHQYPNKHTRHNTDTQSLQGNEKEGTHLLIRPLRESDLTPIKQQLKLETKLKSHDQFKLKPKAKSKSNSKAGRQDASETQTLDAASFLAMLDQQAPGDSRFTIPVLAIARGGADVPMAVPTMDLRFPGSEAAPWRIKWEWKYKMIDLEALKLMGSV
ncbi:hypothetical protein BDV06DRAFT_235388 [Aspergillus oleicola]